MNQVLAALVASLSLGIDSSSQTLPERPFPAETGKLRLEGRRFFDAQNRVWRWRGATQFLLFSRYLSGEDIGPVLDWLVERGFNVIRVFGQVPVGFGADRLGMNYERPFDRPDFDERLHAFFSLLADRGLRVEYVPLTYSDDLGVMRAHVQRVYDVARSHWNVLIEVGNEPEYNGIDVVAVMKGVNRHGVLSAYGLDPSRHPAATLETDVPVLDYGTTHDIHRDFEHSPRITKDAWDWQNRFGVPFVSDEPIGFIDFDHPFFVRTGTDPMGGALFGGFRGGGARTTNCDVIRSAAAIAYLLTAGYTFHLQAGVEGWRPEPSEPLQEACARSLAEIAAFIPNDIQLGEVVEPGKSDFGLAWTGNPRAESLVDRAYGVVLDNRQWVVVPVPSPDWSAAPVNGWRIDAVGPVPYLIRLVK
jgi:hypothetical protein